jgi:glycosyltransferase involved in cell wall biosynthesis
MGMTPHRLRVLLVIKGLGVGGAERLLERAIPYLDREAFEYQVAYLLPWKDALVPPFRAAGIPVHCLEYRAPLDLRVIRRFRALVRRERFALVHAHLPVAGLLARLSRRLGDVPRVIYTEHGVPSHYRWPTRWANVLTYRWADAVIAVSEAVAAGVRPYIKGDRPRLVTIVNALDADGMTTTPETREAVRREFGIPADAPLVVTVGNLRPVKGHTVLLAAARRVLAAEPRARFLIVGVGPLAEHLPREARRLGLDGQVIFAGFRADATPIIAASDVYVLPSLDEGLPVSLLEAMALGRAVVATRVGGIPEVVLPDRTGILVEPNDPERLAWEVLGLLQTPERRRQLGEAAQAAARQRYGMGSMVTAVEQLYREVVA